MAKTHPYRRGLQSGRDEHDPELDPQRSHDALGFQGTIWTEVEAAGANDQEIRLAALSILLTKYEAPMRAYLRVKFGWRPGVNRECLEDWFQSFIERKMMLKGLIETADPSRGRFRDLLKKALWNFAMQEYRARLRRTGKEVAMQEGGEEVAATEQHDCPEVEKEWARRVFLDALLELESGCKQGNQELIWIIFLRRRLFPLAGQEPAESLEQTVACVQRAYGKVLTPQQISNCQKTAERKLSRCISNVLAEYCRDAEAIEKEKLALIEILRGGVSLPTRLRPPHPAS